MKRIEIIFKDCNGLIIISDEVVEFNNTLKILDIKQNKMFYININETLYYTIKPLNYKEETNG